MMTVKQAYLFFALVYSISLFSNTPDESKLRVFNEDTVYFFGYDFSHMKFTPGDRPVNNRDVAMTIDAWIGYQKFYITPQTTLRRWLKKSSVELVPCFFGCQYNEERNWLTESHASYTVPLDTIQKTIDSYSLPVEVGVGFVVHAINLNKSKEKAFCRFTFFDLATGEIIWSELAMGRPDDHGFNKYWGIGIHFSVKNYIDRFYKPEYVRLIIDRKNLEEKQKKKEKNKKG